MSNKKSNNNKKSNPNNRMMPSLRILIAVIAIFECLILISFTTYSWIESNSSLVIMNGPQNTISTDPVNIDIADTLNFRINLDQESSNADLNTFYRFTKDYRYGKASSPDGTTFYFPKKNNTYATATTFRRGDTTDYNTSYTYFDFEIYNNVGNRDFYFADNTDAAKYVFTVEDKANYFSGKTYDDGGVTKNKIDAIKNAMRLSITTTADDTTTTRIYSPTGDSYRAQNGLSDFDHSDPNDAGGATVDPEKIEDFGINKNAAISNPNQRLKLFTSKKSSTKVMKVAVRIWFEIMDPDFQKAFNITHDTNNPNSFNARDFAAIAGVAININLTFANNANNYIPFYFDDYTIDNTAANRGNNMTLANANNSSYKVWFHGWNPDANNGSGDYVDYPMERDTSIQSSEYTRWSADSVPQVVTDHLMSGITSAHLNGSYFVYGTNTSSSTKWYLYSQPGSGVSEFAYKAYSRTYNGTTTYGAGIWDTPMTLISFKDMATGITSSAFNNDGTNYQYMNSVASQDYDHYHVFVSNYDAGNTFANNFDTTRAQEASAMFYDATEHVFKAYVPSTWLNNNGSLYFNYSISGAFSVGATNARWFGRGSYARGGSYIYTALGYHDNYILSAATSQTSARTNAMPYAQGVGTWNDVEPIHFSAELIDASHSSAYRYFVNIGGSFGRAENTAVSYPMVPDAANMVYTAYIPSGLGTSTANLSFCRYNGYNNSWNTYTYDSPTVNWGASLRDSSSTYYPVDVDTTAASGYWNLSVLVDSTYENLIYDTLTDSDGMGTSGANCGMLEYSLDDGSTWTTLKDQSSTDINRIDAYRWYVPCANGGTVTYRWTPYYGTDKTFGTADDTTFIFTHDTSEGLYCVITESPNAMTFNTTPVIRRSAAALAATGFEAQIEPGAAAAATEQVPDDIGNDEESYEESYDETTYDE